MKWPQKDQLIGAIFMLFVLRKSYTFFASFQ